MLLLSFPIDLHFFSFKYFYFFFYLFTVIIILFKRVFLFLCIENQYNVIKEAILNKLYNQPSVVNHVNYSSNRTRPLSECVTLNKPEPISKLQAESSQPIREHKVGKMASSIRWRCVSVLLFVVFILSVHCSNSNPKKKKDIRDYNDADMAKLLEQWEVIRIERRRTFLQRQHFALAQFVAV